MSSGNDIGGQIDGCDDRVLDMLDEEENDESINLTNKDSDDDNDKPFTFIITNARSLCPKIKSLIDCMEEMDCSVGVVTETWLSDGDFLETDIANVAAEAGIGMICLNREPNAAGVSHGGVAVTYKTDLCSMKRVEFDKPDKFKVLVTVASLPGYSRRLLTVACYLPPRYTVHRGRAAIQCIEDIILDVKRPYRDPFIIVASDFNQWTVEDAIQEYHDLRESAVGPTRRGRCLDCIFTNFGRSELSCGTLPPWK